MAVATAALVLSACAPPEPVTTQPRPESPAPVATPAPAPIEYAPLRGTELDGESSPHPSLAAKIDNHPAARPQYGLETADIVFEQLVEGGLTRYVALWHSTIPDVIGPVRSIRPMDPDIISPMSGIVAYSGGQDRFVSAMRAAPVYNAIHGEPGTEATFARTDAKRPPHNVVVAARKLVAEHPQLAPPAEQFDYAVAPAVASAIERGDPARRIETAFSPSNAPSWSFDLVSGSYLRSQNGAPDLDRSGAPLSSTNVVVLRVQIENARDVPRTILTGTGQAWVSTGGNTLPATWSKASAESALRLVDRAGAPVALGAGNTWVELVPAITGDVRLIAG